MMIVDQAFKHDIFAACRLLTVSIMRGTMLAMPVLAHAQSCPAPQPASNMTMTFDSEFKVGALNPSQWNNFPNQPVTINGELESYAPSEVVPSVAAGLRLQTHAKPINGKQYSSAQVSTRGLFSQEYGHFEMRARVPQADGMWPAFWLMPENNASNREIDVLEYIYAPWGQVPTAQKDTSYASVAAHWIDANGVWQSYGSTYSTPLDWGTQYHNYAIDWRPGSLVYEIDGIVVGCLIDTPQTGSRVPATPMFMIMNDAISPPNGWPGTLQSKQKFPLNFDIAYVRVSQFKDLPATPPLTGDIVDATISSSTVAQGGTLQFSAKLVTGNTPLGASNSVIQIKSWDGSVCYAWIYVSANLPANATTPITATYTVPTSLAPGSYIISVWTAYNNWANAFYNPEAQVFTVTAPAG